MFYLIPNLLVLTYVEPSPIFNKTIITLEMDTRNVIINGIHFETHEI